MTTYEELLKRGLSKISEKSAGSERFEIPKAVVITQGNKTIVKNIGEIASELRTEESHISKFLLKELATGGSMVGKQLVFQRKVMPQLINNKIEEYVKEFVFCKECGKHDTKLTRGDRITTLRCEVCGARRVVREL